MFLRFILLALVVFLLPISQSFCEEAVPLEITVLNAGYADAILIRSSEGRNILLDSGDVKRPELVAAFLREKKIDLLDLFILSHPHKNHFGAFFQVLDKVHVKEVVWNGEPNPEEPFSALLEKIRGKNIPIRKVKAGDRLKITQDLEFQVLHPGNEMTDNLNNNALALKMTFQKISALFTTDIGYGVQNNLIKKHKKKLAANLVQIPHHGGPISEKYIEFFKPDFFFLSTGPSEWAPPREAEIAKLKGQVFRTDKDGTLVFQSDGRKIWKV